MIFKNLSIALVFVGALLAGSPALADNDPKAPPVKVEADAERPRVELALLLDTSSSMDGLISQAKSQLWKVVNELTLARREGQSPDIAVAVYEYGNSRLDASTGFIRQVLPLTTDLDKVSEQLFELSTNGGSEHCGQVIDRAVSELKWSERSDALKMIFIAGNEPFTQGPTSYKEAITRSLGKGVTVNTIFCGAYAEGDGTGWSEAARLADGRYLNIDQDRVVTAIAAPQDEDLRRLNEDLNKTYVPIGERGEAAQERQKRADSGAAAAPAADAEVERAVFKGSKNYKAADWDLVDALVEGRLKLDEVADEKLPEEWRELSLEQRKAKVEALTKERAEIKDKIQELARARREYIEAERAKDAEATGKTLDQALIDAVRAQAAKKSYGFEGEK